jgi:hypothetical protein
MVSNSIPSSTSRVHPSSSMKFLVTITVRLVHGGWTDFMHLCVSNAILVRYGRVHGLQSVVVGGKDRSDEQFGMSGYSCCGE